MLCNCPPLSFKAFPKILYHKARVKSEDTSHRCQVNRLSSIISYWRKITTKKERRPHNLTKDGIMGEISGCGLPVLLRFSIPNCQQQQLFQIHMNMVFLDAGYAISMTRISLNWWFSDGERVCGRVFGNSFYAISSPFWQSPLPTGANTRLYFNELNKPNLQINVAPPDDF